MRLTYTNEDTLIYYIPGMKTNVGIQKRIHPLTFGLLIKDKANMNSAALEYDEDLL